MHLRAGLPEALILGLGLVAASLSLAMVWTVLLGLRDVVLGYPVRIGDGKVSWPHHLWSRSVALSELSDARVGDDGELDLIYEGLCMMQLLDADGAASDEVGTFALSELEVTGFDVDVTVQSTAVFIVESSR